MSTPTRGGAPTPESAREIKRILSLPPSSFSLILNSPSPFSALSIRKSYHALSLLVHPDKTSCENANEAMVLLTNAYQELENARKNGDRWNPTHLFDDAKFVNLSKDTRTETEKEHPFMRRFREEREGKWGPDGRGQFSDHGDVSKPPFSTWLAVLPILIVGLGIVAHHYLTVS